MTTMLDHGMTLEEIVGAVLEGFTVQFLDEAEIGYRCNCSESKVTRALISLGVSRNSAIWQTRRSLPRLPANSAIKCDSFSPEELRNLK